jgi:tRNA (cmo5U34)-methyltransferase
VLEALPDDAARVLDLGTGDGRLLELVLTAHPAAEAVAVDFNSEMLRRARDRFDGRAVAVFEHDLDDALLGLGAGFDAVVSSFAIHHVSHDRKRALFGEVFAMLRPGGMFANLEHVSSPTERLHVEFLEALDIDPADEDPSNILAPVADQLTWLTAAGFGDVDCLWKWRENALLVGRRPAGPSGRTPAP